MFTAILSCWQLGTGGGCQICEPSIVLASFNLWTITSKHSSHLHQYCNDGGGLGQCSYCLTVSSWGSQMQWTSPWCWSHSGLSSHSVSISCSKKCYLLICGVIISLLIYNVLYIADTSLVWYILGWHWVAKACGCGCRQQQVIMLLQLHFHSWRHIHWVFSMSKPHCKYCKLNLALMISAHRWVICCKLQHIGEIVLNLVVWRIQRFW